MKTNRIKKNSYLPTGKDISAWILILPAVLCIYLFVVRPQIQGIYWSFFNMQGYKVLDFVGLENYRRVLADPDFKQALVNTFKYVGWSLVLGFAVPIVVAVILNELVHFRNTFRFFTYFPAVLPAMAVSLLWYMMYYPDQGGLLNMFGSWLGLEPYNWLQDSKRTIMLIVVSMTWNGCGSTALYYFASLQGISRELYEAALIDGAGFIKRFFVVVIPHISGIALLFLVKQIIGVFSIMEQPMQMTDGGPNGASSTLGLLAYKYGFVSIKPHLGMTVGVIMFLILMVLTIFYFFLDKKIERD